MRRTIALLLAVAVGAGVAGWRMDHLRDKGPARVNPTLLAPTPPDLWWSRP